MVSTASSNSGLSSRLSPLTARPAQIANWLLGVAFLVFVMIVVGGITRLTESGLSITEWKPVTGAIPPLNEEQWLAEFEKYKQIPEYKEVNYGMSLSEFKFIFFWEWVHRLLGRLIGLAFAIPLAYFAIKKAIPEGYGKRLLALLALGGLQGAIGWWMVTSGLSERTDVSHYRLATHLLIALFILAGLVWTALDLFNLNKSSDSRPARFSLTSLGVSAIVFIQLLYGAWVAGLNAGHAAYTWPSMNGSFFPQNANWQGLISLADDMYIVQFIHRWWAWVAVAALIYLARKVKQAGYRPVAIAIHAAFATQIALGIFTLISGMNITIAVLHQAVGAILVGIVTWGVHCIGRRA